MFRLKTFGGLSLEGATGAVGGRGAQRRRLALLAVLASARGAVSRDRLLAWFWPEHDSAHARHALSQAVYELRRTLGDRALLGGADDLRLDPSLVASDVHAFEAALDAGQPERAIPWYAGPFLDGFYLKGAPEFERWVETERSRLLRRGLGAVETRARAATARGDLAAAADWWHQATLLDPLDARLARARMRALAAAGDARAAVRHAAVHAAALRAELEAEPDPEVEQLAAELAARPPEPPSPVGHPGRQPALPTEAHRPARSLRPYLLAAVGIVLLVTGAGFARQVVRRAPPTARAIVLGSVESSDPHLGLAVEEALRAELEATPAIRVTPDHGIRETLRLMRLPADTALGPEVAIQVAARRGVPLVVLGTVAPLGTGATITARVIDVRTGDVVATATARPERPEDIVSDVARVVRAVRAQVTGARVDSLSPLPAVTTASLPALERFAQARAAASRGDRWEAIDLLDAALVYDSNFALAHYLLGDLLWFVDRQQRSEFHLDRAIGLSHRLPPREQLIVRARHEQLVRDRPDSALVAWQRLRAAIPGERYGYEGMAWTYRAIGDFVRAAAAADTALQLDPDALAPNFTNRLYALLAAGSVADAGTLARAHTDRVPWAEDEVRMVTAFLRGDTVALVTMLRAAFPADPTGMRQREAARRWQLVYLAGGRLEEAERAMTVVVRAAAVQEPPRALLLQARAELEFGGSPDHAAALAREAFAWTRNADLSPPAYARLLERVADVAARAGDLATLDHVERFLEAKDRGRGLRSYVLALRAVAAYRALAAQHWRQAYRAAVAARAGAYFARSVSPLVLLTADARAGLGDPAATAVYDSVATWPVAGDGDYETWVVMRAIAARRRQRLADTAAGAPADSRNNVSMSAGSSGPAKR